MTLKVGYCPWFEKNWSTTNTALNYYGWYDLAYFDLDKLDTWENSTSRFWKCPAFVHYVNGIYVLRCPVDITLDWDPNNKVISSNLPKEAHDAMFRIHWGDFDVDKGHPIIAIHAAYVFVADKPAHVEFFPPYNHLDNSWRLIPGSFNIYSWQRPVLPTFEMLQNRVELKRGQPLAYIRFRSEDLKENVSLEKIERNEKLEHAVNSCLTLKHYMPNLSWKIHNAVNKLRPKRWMK